MSIGTADAVGTLINIKVAVVVGESWCTGATEVIEQVGASCSVQTGIRATLIRVYLTVYSLQARKVSMEHPLLYTPQGKYFTIPTSAEQ